MVSAGKYDRQERVNGWEQNKLFDLKTAIIGAGALGTIVSLQLTSLGVGRIDIFDFDKVENHNLNRQFFYFDSVGKNKAISLVSKLRFINPDIKINAYNTKIIPKNVNILSGYDIIFDCTDNWTIRKILNQYCYKNKIKLVHGGMRGFEGQIQCINPTKNTACLECIPLPKDENPSRVCEVDPAIVTTSFLIGSIMAQEGIKTCLFPNKVYYGLIIYNGFTEDLKKMNLTKNPKCPTCK